mmetsp:Transcript_70297/g.177147  ORF Transcript_70297/g.177147 Transcript_70297/m.177147 type:complete len:276 (-) Transcript_70297:60-887(-)
MASFQRYPTSTPSEKCATIFLSPKGDPGYCSFVNRFSPFFGIDTGNRPFGLAAPVKSFATAGPTCSPGMNSMSTASAPSTQSVSTGPGTNAMTTTFFATAFTAVTNSWASGTFKSFLSQPSSACAETQTTATSAPAAAPASGPYETCASVMAVLTPSKGVIVLSVSTYPLPPPEYALPCLNFLSFPHLQYFPTMTIFFPAVARGKVLASFFKRTVLSVMVLSATARCASLEMSSGFAPQPVGVSFKAYIADKTCKAFSSTWAWVTLPALSKPGIL